MKNNLPSANKKKLPPSVEITEGTKANLSCSEEEFLHMMGTNSSSFATSLVDQMIAVLTAKGGSGEKEINSALAALNGLDCKDEVEAIIGSHVVCLNSLILSFLSDANSSNQTSEGKDANINRACKLLRAFASQIETLNRYKNRGSQKMTVEHVNINQGGKAVFGDINSSPVNNSKLGDKE